MKMRDTPSAVWPALLAVAVLAGCATTAPKDTSYAVLLKSPDGSVGKVVLRGNQGEQLLSQERQGALLNGSQAPTLVDEATLQRDFGEAMAARPELPEHFTLYFESGGTQLTQESANQLRGIVERAGKRASMDVSVIGHSDTVGKSDINEALALKRAQSVAELLRSKGIKLDSLSVESHGKRNLLVPTPDETPEPRNRRVEVSIR